ncbi:hypothetical protein A8990_13232 [Paenibacillus taihuensis]|uniref:Uncharacterized protein n=1 Tax=Paenibacillus taihuensis TaxID=1156355 RepID=A0A3D9R2U9_9BACL|nr:hypothetical protein [Paenibacillus taihuensis]REE69635.1 hypothetical protein A8990_13232 [Paenibacillus taihuensis]
MNGIDSIIIPFLVVSADSDPAEYPELVEELRSHQENIVRQIASLQQVVNFIDMKLDEGEYRRDCSDEHQDGVSEKRPISPVEMSYFSVSAKAGKSPASVSITSTSETDSTVTSLGYAAAEHNR